MIYLFSQIAISLVLAAIVGGALGWIAQRVRSRSKIQELQQVVSRQQQQVSDAKTEVNILSDDFNDLKERSESKIRMLSEENQAIPDLNQNLEKSQLLVRQMIEQHKTELDETNEEKAQLLVRSRQVDDLEFEVTKLQTKLDIAQRNAERLETQSANNSAQRALNNAATSPDTGSDHPANLIDSKSVTPIDTASTHANTHAKTASVNAAPAELAQTTAEHTDSPATNTAPVDSAPAETARANFANTDTTPADIVLTEAATSDSTPFDNNQTGDSSKGITSTTGAIKLPLSGNSISTNSQNEQYTDEAPVYSNDDTLPNAAQTKAELQELRDQLASDIPTNNTRNSTNSHSVDVSPSFSRPHKLAETQVDDASLEQMFDTVDQHDDLKQIFGIGPLTEKTLNKLGITAYSQLAELKQHDIEKIADALQIFPGRIERDNWVGSARLQLEEVLEDL